MEVSIALVQSLEELLQTAVTRLTAEIKAETKPERLDTLLTLAFRARLPRIPSARTPPRTSPPTSPVPYPDRAAGSEHERPPESKPHANDAIPSPPHPRPQSGRGCRVLATGEGSGASLNVEDEDDLAVEVDDEAPTNEELPHYLTHMTDDEFTKLQREIGFHEANRRRLIRAHLASNHARTPANSS